MKDSMRFVVFDQESTGLNPDEDRIVSIGAVAVKDGEVMLDDVFEAVLRVNVPTVSVLVHGITPDQSRRGRDEREAVGAFLDYVGAAVLVGHHVGFDIALLRSAGQRSGRDLSNPALDTMRLALGLEEKGLLALDPEAGFSLDGLCRRFGVALHDRHTAPGDAFLTAQVFVRLLRICARADLDPMTFRESSHGR